MKDGVRNFDLGKLPGRGLLITLGLVYGNIGTSPLYTFKAVVHNAGEINDLLIYGSLSSIFWTITLLATVKYIIITIQADNKGEGGIFALFALLRKKTTLAALVTMIGGGALMADGILTPAITLTSSIEGISLLRPAIAVIPAVLAIFCVIFFVQQFGINFYAWGLFGPMMVLWFIVIAVLGGAQIINHPGILGALNPVYAVKFLANYPGAFILLGFIFLCVTGAESIYSDLGHCGRRNIRISWAFVKTSLVLNYFGQGAWILSHREAAETSMPFFSIMPQWFLIPGIIIAVLASVIATQSLIRASFTLITEAVSLNFWPKIRIMNPTDVRGQVYLPFINWTLLILCSIAVIVFRESSNMEVAYGLAIAITMLMTTFLLIYYLNYKGINFRIAVLLLSVFFIFEGFFLVSNLNKFMHGGWFTIGLASVYFLIMFSWYFGRKIKNRRITFTRLDGYIQLFKDLQEDKTIPKTATNLVYIIKANNTDQVESKVIYSIFNKQPKRADHYWLLHVDIVEEPYRCEYKVTQIIPGILIRVDFHIGFKVDPKINLHFREVVDDLVRSGEIKIESGYDSLRKHGFPGDFKFVILERIMLPDFKLSNMENFILTIRGFVRKISISDEKALQLDSSNTIVEQVPILVNQPVEARIQPLAH
ncbi:MAG TPA: KUP/HAK/KT family potassium transporter [Bacteroidales bacterium]|jgi:KUP system potassium uptake protein|nr:KUP/HAK/KT family potassium transporter [Bacteroidales bacterium]